MSTLLRHSGRPGIADYRWDDELAGFGIRIYPSGRKSFVLSYRAKGRSRFFTLGRFGPMTVHEARTRALEVLGATRRGGDPAGARAKSQGAPTIADLAERYMREHALPKKKASSVGTDARIWKLHVLPHLGKAKLTDVTRADIARLHATLGETPYLANRLVALLSKAFNLAEVWGWRPDGSNPCRHIERYREEKKERFLSPAELARLEIALSEAERAQLAPAPAIAAIRLLIFTGCRVSEIVTLHWNEVDFEHRWLRLSDSKTGRKLVCLNSEALGVLSLINRGDERDFVIGGAKPGSHFVGLSRVWFRIRRRAGLDDVRLHDVRHSYASVGAGLGLSLPIIGGLLGHAHPATTQRYAHLAAGPMHEANERIGAALGAALSGRVNVTETVQEWGGPSS